MIFAFCVLYVICGVWQGFFYGLDEFFDRLECARGGFGGAFYDYYLAVFHFCGLEFLGDAAFFAAVLGDEYAGVAGLDVVAVLLQGERAPCGDDELFVYAAGGTLFDRFFEVEYADEQGDVFMLCLVDVGGEVAGADGEEDGFFE